MIPKQIVVIKLKLVDVGVNKLPVKYLLFITYYLLLLPRGINY
jgi:hypothetical protein